MRRDATVGAILRLDSAVAVGDVEILRRVVLVGGHVVVHVEGNGRLVLHVSVACAGRVMVSVEQIGEVHGAVVDDAIPPLALRCEKQVADGRQSHEKQVRT